MKNEALMKPFPNNLFDDLEIECPSEQPEDFLATLMYILRCVATPRDSKAIMMRYKEGKSYEEIGEAFGLSKQRAHYMISDILCKFTKQYTEMLSKGIKQYMEDMLMKRIEELMPTISESEREMIKLTAFDEGYYKGYEDGVSGRKAIAMNKDALNNIDISTLQLSTRTHNALCRNEIKTLGDILASGDKLAYFDNFGKTCFSEIIAILKTYGVDIKSSFPNCVKKWSVA